MSLGFMFPVYTKNNRYSNSQRTVFANDDGILTGMVIVEQVVVAVRFLRSVEPHHHAVSIRA